MKSTYCSLNGTSYSSLVSHTRYRSYQYPPTQVTILKFKNGSIGHVASSIACTQPYDFPTYIIGTNGTLKDNLIYTQDHRNLGQKEWQSTSMTLLKSGAVEDHPYLTQFSTFINDIVTGNNLSVTTKLNAAIQSHKIIFAADLSAKLNQPVRIDNIDSLLLDLDDEKVQSSY